MFSLLPSLARVLTRNNEEWAVFWTLSALLLSFTVSAKEIMLPPMPVSPYTDTEVATNIVFNRHRSDVKEFELKFTLDCSPSNCIQVAFGTDVNEDGDLSFAETGSVYGWRNGRYFIEDVVAGKRYQQSNDADERTGTQVFSVNMHTTRDYLPKTFLANIDGVSVFTNLSTTVPTWLYQPKWNLMRITRRGISTPSEWFSCKIDYSYFYITIR
jgi:hypothetical protein